MLPAGLSFNAISAKALAASEHASLKRSYWDWHAMIASNATGYFPYTPATNLLYGLHEALEMLFHEGLDTVFARHPRHAEATRSEIGRAHVCTPVTTAHLVCRLLLETQTLNT